MGRKVLFFLVLLFFISFAYSFSDDISIKRVAIPNIYDPKIWDITQDTTGFMWFVAPDFGVFRFNGNKFFRYKISSSAKPTSIEVTSDNNVFVAARDSLFRYDKYLDKFIVIKLDTLPDNGIRFLNVLDNNNLLFGTLNNVFEYNCKKKRLKHLFSIKQVNDVLVINENTYLCATKDGLFLKELSKMPKLISDKINVKKIKQDKSDNNVYWYISRNKLYKYDFSLEKIETYRHNNKILYFLDLDLSKKNKIIISSSHGIIVFDKNDKKFKYLTENQFSNFTIYTSFFDRNGVFWGATKRGLIKTSPINKIEKIIEQEGFEHYNPFIKQMNVYGTENIIAINGDNYIFEIENNSLKVYDFLKDLGQKIRPTSIIKLQNDKIWIFTKTGIYVFNEKDDRLRQIYDEGIFYAQLERDGTIICSDMYQVLHFNKEEEIINSYDLLNVTSHTAVNDSIYWFSSHTNGIWKYNINQNEKLSKIDRTNISKSVYGNLLFHSGDSTLYIGTIIEGLFIYNLLDNSIIHYNENNGIPSNKILGIVRQGNKVWANTKNGLVLLEDNRIASILDHTKGFQCYFMSLKSKAHKFSIRTNNNIWTMKNNKIAIGGRNGINVFSPAKLFEKSSKSPLLLTDIQVFGESVYNDNVKDFVKKYIFSHKDRIITFDFAVLNYEKLNSIKYSFKLENFNKNWVFSDKNSITYNNLEPGEYYLRTRYSDYSGESWRGPTYEIIITPPFWQTYSFWIIVIVVTGIAVFSVIKIQTYRIRNQKVSLEYRVLQRTRDLQEKKDELQHVNQRLEELVDVRTKKLTKTNKQLINEIEEKEKVYNQLQQSQKRIKSNLKMQTSLSELSIKFISLENFEEKISNTLQTIGEKFGFSSVFLYQTRHFVKEKNTLIQWLKDDTIEKHSDLTQQKYEDYLSVLHSNGEILIEDARESDIEIHSILEKIDTRSLFIVPLMVGQKFYGFIGVDKRKEKYPWDNSILHFIRTIGHMLAYAYERRAFQSELLESEKTSRALLNASDSFAILFNVNARIELANHNFLKVINKSLDEAIGHTIYDFFPPAHIEERTKQFSNCLKTKKAAEFEDQLNDQFYYNSITPIFDIDGKIKRIAFFSTNITKLKEAERILKRHQEELQKEVEARTKELRFINNELVREIRNRERAEEELRETEKVKRENLKKLALQLAHEIKNPLSSIKSSAQLVETIQNINPDVKSTIKHMERITRNVDTCNRVIKELYEFTHDAELQIQKIKIGALFSEVLDYTESLLENSPVSLKSESNIYDLCVSIDKFKLMQALKNIINNSKEAIVDEGEITIDFIEKNKVLNIRIADTGTGMKGEQLNKIFEPFFTSKSKGFGLGLAIVKKIIEQHRGTITVTSQIGEGTETIITLPCVIECNGEKNG